MLTRTVLCFQKDSSLAVSRKRQGARCTRGGLLEATGVDQVQDEERPPSLPWLMVMAARWIGEDRVRKHWGRELKSQHKLLMDWIWAIKEEEGWKVLV